MPEERNPVLSIGGVDTSDHVICEAIDIQTAPVWSNAFTAVNGKVRKKCMGESVSLSANFQVLRKDIAEAIVNACKADKVTVVYEDPTATTTVFERPTVTRSPALFDGVTSYWNVSVSMTCPLKGNGL